MDARDEELVKALAPENADLRRSYERHAKLSAEVEELRKLVGLAGLPLPPLTRAFFRSPSLDG